MAKTDRKILAWLGTIAIFCVCIFSYAVYNIYESYELSNNRDYSYHPVCINNHLYIRMIPRLGITPAFDRNYSEPRLISCSVKDGEIIYDKDSLSLLNNE